MTCDSFISTVDSIKIEIINTNLTLKDLPVQIHPSKLRKNKSILCPTYSLYD